MNDTANMPTQSSRCVPFVSRPHLSTAALVCLIGVVGLCARIIAAGEPVDHTADGQLQWDRSLQEAGATPEEIQETAQALHALSPDMRRETEESWRTSSPASRRKQLWMRRVSKVIDEADPAPTPIFPHIAPICSVEDLRKVVIPNTTIASANVEDDGTCRVTAIITHPPAADRIKVYIALPLDRWNGRFLGTGGAGFSGGSAERMAGPAHKGFAVGATDTGHEGYSGSFALDANGRLNWQGIRDFAYLGIHDMTVVGKALTTAFYGKAPAFAYFKGTSNGGRQALAEAQRFPGDYDGIVAGCPAIDFDRLGPVLMWPQLVMHELRDVLPASKIQAANDAAIESGKQTNGAMGAYLDDPRTCAFDPRGLIGERVGGSVFTETDAEVLRRIWEGPRRKDGSFLWYGYERGSSITDVASSEGSPLHGVPNAVALDYCRYFLKQNANWDWSTLTQGEFEQLWDQSSEEFGSVFGTDHRDLTDFNQKGGKLIIWHGWDDGSIPPRGSINYYDRIQGNIGQNAESFVRLFMLPGVIHGFGGKGPQPAGMLTAVMGWVENGKVPDRILTPVFDVKGVQVGSRPVFPYPKVAKYTGKGSVTDASNFVSADPAPK